MLTFFEIRFFILYITIQEFQTYLCRYLPYFYPQPNVDALYFNIVLDSAQCATGVSVYVCAVRCKGSWCVLAWKFEAGGQSRRAVASRQLPPASKRPIFCAQKLARY